MINQSRYRSFIWIYMASISLSLGTLVYSNIVNSMNDAMNTMLIVFDISDQYKSVIRGMLTGSAYLGALIGVIMSSFIIHLSTRKLTFIMDAFMIIGLSLLTINNLPLFLIGRILAGVGGGMSSILTAIFVKQLAPKEIYGYIGGISQILFGMGYCLTAFYGLLFQDTDGLAKENVNQFWRIYFISPAIINVTRIVLLLTFVNFDTPIYYVSQSNDEGAREVLQKFYKQEYVEEELQIVKDQYLKKGKAPKLFKKPMLGRTLFAMYFCFFYQFCGFNAVIQYSTLIFTDIFSERIALYLTLLMSFLKFLFYSNGSIITNKFGRRKPLLIGVFFINIANLLIMIFSFILQNSSEEQEIYWVSQYVIFGCIFLFVFSNFNTLGFVIAVYIPEIVPPNGALVAFQVFWLSALTVVSFFPILKSWIGMSFCFLIFFSVTFVSEIVLYKFGVETKNKSDNEIDEIFQKLTRKDQTEDSLIPLETPTD